MTTRNLNRTWRDVVFKQYADDYEADVPFPVRYLINTPQWSRAIIIEVPNKIEIKTLRQSIGAFFRAKHTSEDPTYDDGQIAIRLQVPGSQTSAIAENDSEEQSDLP